MEYPHVTFPTTIMFANLQPRIPIQDLFSQSQLPCYAARNLYHTNSNYSRHPNYYSQCFIPRSCCCQYSCIKPHLLRHVEMPIDHFSLSQLSLGDCSCDENEPNPKESMKNVCYIVEEPDDDNETETVEEKVTRKPSITSVTSITMSNGAKKEDKVSEVPKNTLKKKKSSKIPRFVKAKLQNVKITRNNLKNV